MEENIAKDDQKPESELEACQKKADEYLNSWKRAAADLINYKKEEMERMVMLGNYAKESMIEKVLPIFDSFYLAATAVGGIPSEGGKKHVLGELKNSDWFKGFSQIKNQIEEFLQKEGIEEIVAMGQKFDPNSMEIVSEEASGNSQLASGTVLEELQKGYKMSGKILRPAKVKVSK